MAYPIAQGAAQRWKYRPIANLLGGLNVAAQPDSIDDTQTITLNNVLAKGGQLLSDSGYDTLGQVVVGQPQDTHQFKRLNQTITNMLITTSTVYKYDTIVSKWLLVKGTASTTTTAAYAAGITVIVVSSGAGFNTGDLVGITLDNGDQLQTTVTVSGTTFTLADAIPVGRSALNGAAVIRAVVLNGNVDYQVSFVTIPGSDWVVFTNGVDIVKRYNGTDCIDVPGLPSSGNIICRYVILYNTALFLLNTIEGGTNHPQRCRRSDQTDITNWTTGTAGFDDLLDTADIIHSGELLGPYLIIYRDRSIARGSFIGSSGLNYQFETTITGEGIISSKAVVNLGDSHIIVGHAGVYMYHGDYSLTSLADAVYNKLFGYSSDMHPSFHSRLFSLFVGELNEVWIAYVSSTSTEYCDKFIRYHIKDKRWYTRTFANSFIGFGFYERQETITWNTLIGSWTAQTWAWADRLLLSNAPVVHLCSADTNQVYEYDYYSTLDNRTAIGYTVETKDFTSVESKYRLDMVEMFIRGTDILLEYSTDSGHSWNTLATITQATQDRLRLYKQLITNRIRFRWTGSSPDFALEWFGFSYKVESLY